MNQILLLSLVLLQRCANTNGPNVDSAWLKLNDSVDFKIYPIIYKPC